MRTLIVALLLLSLPLTAVEARGRRARLASTMGGRGNAGSWLPRGPLFDFDHGAGFDLPGFGDPLDGDEEGGTGGGGTGGGTGFGEWGGSSLQNGEGWEFGDGGGIDTSFTGGCGKEDCYQPTWVGPCVYKCECVVTWDQRRDARKDATGIPQPGTCYYEEWVNEPSAGSCRRDRQNCETIAY